MEKFAVGGGAKISSRMIAYMRRNRTTQSPKPPTAADRKMIDLMKARRIFSVIVGSFESSMPSTSCILSISSLKFHASRYMKKTLMKTFYMFLSNSQSCCKHCGLTTTIVTALQIPVFYKYKNHTTNKLSFSQNCIL